MGHRHKESAAHTAHTAPTLPTATDAHIEGLKRSVCVVTAEVLDYCFLSNVADTQS
jgi:hypothetical protein